MPVYTFEHNCNTRDGDKKGEKATESRGTVTEGVHLTPELGGTGENLPKQSVKQRDEKPVTCPPLPQCSQYSFFELHWEEN